MEQRGRSNVVADFADRDLCVSDARDLLSTATEAIPLADARWLSALTSEVVFPEPAPATMMKLRTGDSSRQRRRARSASVSGCLILLVMAWHPRWRERGRWSHLLFEPT